MNSFSAAKFRNLLFFIPLVLMLPVQHSHAQIQRLPKLEDGKILLTNMAIQIECTSGVDNLYNFKFDQAESQFRWLQRNYPAHPLPYFLLGLVEWWKIVPNVNDKQYDEKFLSYMDSTVYFAEALFERDEQNAEAPFFLAAAYAFEGRLHSERQSWTRAAIAGKRALKYLDHSKKYADLSPELLFGDGLYNYYSVWIPENYPVLKPLLIFFDKGDKTKGIEQLETVVKDAFYAKIEAMYFLMRIYSVEEKQPFKALRIAEYLHRTFPDNSYFHRYYARMLYTLGRYPELEKECIEILDKIERNMPGYEAVSGRYASFYLATYYMVRQFDNENAKLYFQKAVTFAEEEKAWDSGYYLHSLAGLGKILAAEKQMDMAMHYYEKVLDHADRKHSTHKEARNFRKVYRQYQRAN